MTAMPSLQELAIQCEEYIATPRDIANISHAGLMAVCIGRGLEVICLDKVGNLKAYEVRALQEGIRARQRLGLMKPTILLMLPGRPIVLVNHGIHEFQVDCCLPTSRQCPNCITITPHMVMDRLRTFFTVAAGVLLLTCSS